MQHRPTCSFLFCLLFLSACTSKRPVFTKLNASTTGIQFANTITETDSFNIFTFEYLYNGGGVGIGDFNNDGLQDIFFAGNAVSSKLYLNNGDFRFQDITTTSGTSTTAWCTGVAVIDINGDGWKDLYISTAFPDPQKPAPNLLFINNGINKEGIPTFTEKAAVVGLDDSAYGTQAAFFDYDRDGDLDVYLCINSGKELDRNQLRGQKGDGTGLSQDKLFRNDGLNVKTGLPHFTNVSKEAGIQTEGWGLGVVVKDLNQDGWPDVYVANDFQSNDHLYINNRNGTFTNKIAQYLMHQSHNGMGVDIADCNNDGLEDICVVDMLPEDNLRQKTMFGAVPNEKHAAALRMGYQPQYVRNTLQLNNGALPDSSGTVAFSDIGYLAGVAATDWSWSPLWADFNSDGWRDLLITNGYVKDITDLDFMTYANEYKMFGTSETRIQALRKKVKEMGEVKKPNVLFLNNKNLTFSDSATAWGLSDNTFTNGAAYADLDNDGDLDMVMNNLNDKALIYRNNTIGKKHTDKEKNYLQVNLNGTQHNRDGIGARLWIHYDGQLQYAEQALQRGYLSSIDNRIHFGLGNTVTIDSLIVQWPLGKKQILKNIAPNQTLRLNETNATVSSATNVTETSSAQVFKTPYLLQDVTKAMHLNYTHEENDYLDFLYQYTLPHRYSIQGPSLAVGDVNGDGREDFYMGGASRHSGVFFLQQEHGFSKKLLTGKPEQKRQEETGILLFDADGDGDNDLYCVAGGNEFGDSASYQDLLFLNDGRGNFTDASAALPATTASGSCVVAADYDRDGDLDLFVGGRITPHRYPLAGRSYLLRNDSDPKTHRVLFTDVTAQLCPQLQQPGMVTAALWTDYNGDGFPDLFLAGEFMPLQLYQNEQGRRFKNANVPTFSKTHGWWNALAAGDYDNDGDMDYVAGNLGLNTPYKATEAKPVTVRYNDFNKDGALDAFLFAYNGEREYFTQTRNTVVEQITSLKKKIFYYADFGNMGYTDVFSVAERQGAQELQAFQMASLYIENRGGTFAIKPLPVAAQTAPLYGIVPTDVDGDGNLDLVAIGNSYAPEAITGRYDASVGWVLKGDGTGNFVPLSMQATGFAVRGDGKALVKLRRNKDDCLLIAACNSGPLAAYRHMGILKSWPLQPDDVYVIYILKNGKRRKEEFYYGSSYLSQSGRFITADASVREITVFDAAGRSRTLVVTKK